MRGTSCGGKLGAATDTHTYTAFGEALGRVGTDVQPYQFAGEPYDPNVGFYYNRARWLDPSVGRFASVDSFAGFLNDPSSLHRYTYANINPVNRIDPTGRFASIGGQLASINFLVGLATIGIMSQLVALNVAQNGVAVAAVEQEIERALEAASAAARDLGGFIVQRSVDAAILIANLILIQAWRTFLNSSEFKLPGNHTVEFWAPSGPFDSSPTTVSSYKAGSVLVNIKAGGGGGRILQVVYRIGRNAVPGRGFFLFRLDYLDFTGSHRLSTSIIT